MPLVVVNRNPKSFDERSLENLVRALPDLVASALTCENPDGELTAKDIEVWVQDSGPFDVNTKDVEIIIWANLYPERQADLDRRQRYITGGIKALMNAGDIATVKRISGFVWVLLQPASFGEF